MDGEITFETATLAMEKGFVHGTAQQLGGHQYNYYNNDGSTGVIGWGHLHQDNPTICPQAILKKWLREEHKIIIITIPTFDESKWQYRIANPYISNHVPEGLYNSYEEALEKGLQEGLKLIKKNEEVG